jgi:NAD(P)-dependent dehydrogenase (short-subunit alcohol dehydrogenase family)
MQIRFEGRVAIVTGAGAGLGRSHALTLARRGASIVVNDVGGTLQGAGASTRAADSVVAEIQALGGRAVASYDSVADPEGAKALIGRAVDAFGGVDILINNAGILRDKSFGKMDLQDFDDVVRVHLAGAAYCTHAAWPVMTARKFGRVVLTLSNSGLYGNFGQANYAAAKAGLIGLMNALKIEGARTNILVNAIAPMAATRMTESALSPEILSLFRPEYASAAVAYLCSESFNETGTIVACAGGHFWAVRIVSAPGVQLQGEPSPEAISSAWAAIADMSGARSFNSAQQELAFVVEAAKGAGASASYSAV